MCCRSSITPVDLDALVPLLEIGRFVEQGGGSWQRVVEEEALHGGLPAVNCRVHAPIGGAAFVEFSLNPPISAAIQHVGRRVSASILFEMAWRYAERVNGTVIQRSLIAACRGLEPDLVIANYPDAPLRLENVCVGFQQVLMSSDR